jgi:hypothetical protein
MEKRTDPTNNTKGICGPVMALHVDQWRANV